MHKKEKIKAYRQGDVIFIPTQEKIKGKKLNHLVAAEGEITGHKHEVAGTIGKDAELYENDGVLYLRILSPSVPVKHEEHGKLILPQKGYIIDTPQEYDYVSRENKKIQD